MVCYLVKFNNSFVMVDPSAIKILTEVTIIKLMLLKILIKDQDIWVTYLLLTILLLNK